METAARHSGTIRDHVLRWLRFSLYFGSIAIIIAGCFVLALAMQRSRSEKSRGQQAAPELSF